MIRDVDLWLSNQLKKVDYRSARDDRMLGVNKGNVPGVVGHWGRDGGRVPTPTHPYPPQNPDPLFRIGCDSQCMEGICPVGRGSDRPHLMPQTNGVLDSCPRPIKDIRTISVP